MNLDEIERIIRVLEKLIEILKVELEIQTQTQICTTTQELPPLPEEP